MSIDELDMLQEDCDLDEIVELDLDADGEVIPEKNDKIALIDADTLAFTAALNSQEECELLPREFYSDIEWEELSKLNSFNEAEGTYRQAYVEAGVENAKAKIQRILDKTGCKDVYLVFSGRTNFRYSIYPQYKKNRDRSLTPEGLVEIKDELCKLYPSEITSNWEADDLVVYMKLKDQEKYMLVAVDKDVLNSVEGTHFNYYESALHNKEMHFQEVSKHTAMTWRYIQTLTGDKTDGIEGLHRVGIKTAEKIIADKYSHGEIWQAVVEAYKIRGKTTDDAILTLNLVDMTLLTTDKDGKLYIKLRTKEEMDELK